MDSVERSFSISDYVAFAFPGALYITLAVSSFKIGINTADIGAIRSIAIFIPLAYVLGFFCHHFFWRVWSRFVAYSFADPFNDPFGERKYKVISFVTRYRWIKMLYRFFFKSPSEFSKQYKSNIFEIADNNKKFKSGKKLRYAEILYFIWNKCERTNPHAIKYVERSHLHWDICAGLIGVFLTYIPLGLYLIVTGNNNIFNVTVDLDRVRVLLIFSVFSIFFFSFVFVVLRRDAAWHLIRSTSWDFVYSNNDERQKTERELTNEEDPQ